MAQQQCAQSQNCNQIALENLKIDAAADHPGSDAVGRKVQAVLQLRMKPNSVKP